MKMDWGSASLTRRRALAAATALAAAGAVSSASAAGRSTFSAPSRIGRIVAPQSKRGAAATGAILQGLKTGLSLRSFSADLPDISSYRATPASAPGIRKVGGRTLVIGRPEIGLGRDLLAIDTGANLVREDAGNFPVATLDVWSAAWTTGSWAASELGKRAVIATSFYDSGFDSLYALHRGFEVQGGEVTLFMTHRPDGEIDFNGLARLIEEKRPAVIFAAYSGPEGQQALRYLASAGFGIPIVGSPLLTDETSIEATAIGVFTVLPWAADLPASRDFAAAFGAGVSGFAALGDRAAAMIAGEDSPGPAGFYLRRVDRTDGRPGNRTLADLSALAPTANDKRLAAAEVRSGFSTPYALV